MLDSIRPVRPSYLDCWYQVAWAVVVLCLAEMGLMAALVNGNIDPRAGFLRRLAVWFAMSLLLWLVTTGSGLLIAWIDYAMQTRAS